ncbi:MAG: ATP-binding cassette domain-containing protein [Cyanobacteria bacterium J06649_11]
MGVVFQDLHLIPHWTNRMNIERPLRSLSLETKEKIQDLISIFKMEDFIDKYPAECSRGEEQRVAIARAILMNPEYLLLDEVTSALDPEIVVSIFKYCTVLKEEGTGVFLITHYIPFAKKVADNIYFMANGKIVEEGKKDILTKPSTERLSTFIDNLDYIIGR